MKQRLRQALVRIGLRPHRSISDLEPEEHEVTDGFTWRGGDCWWCDCPPPLEVLHNVLVYWCSVLWHHFISSWKWIPYYRRDAPPRLVFKGQGATVSPTALLLWRMNFRESVIQGCASLAVDLAWFTAPPWLFDERTMAGRSGSIQNRLWCIGS